MELKNKQVKYIAGGTNLLIMVVSLFGILMVINFFFYRHFTRIDLTENKEYSLADSTKEMLRNLDDVVTVKAYFSKKLPPYIANLTDQVRDMLEEFQAYSEGKFNFEFIDPADDPNSEQNLRFLGIRPAQLNVIAKDKKEVMKAYLAMSIHYADKKEIIPLVKNTNNLEYDLVAKLIKICSKKPKTVGLYLRPDLEDAAQKIKAFKEILEKQYQVTLVNLKDTLKVPEKVNTLLVISPKDCPDNVKFALDQFMMRGGNMVILDDIMELAPRSLQATDVSSNLGDLLQHYGVKVENSLVLDLRVNEMGVFSMGFITYQSPYPYWPRLLQQSFDADNPAVNQLENLVLPWTAPVRFIGAGNKSLTGSVLAKTSKFSFIQKGPYNLNPQQKFQPTESELGEQPVVVAVTGKFDSFFKGKSVPKVGNNETQPEIIESSNGNSKLVVVGSSHFIQDDFLRMTRAARDNLTFMTNIVDWLTLGNQLISIRSRKVTERPLKETTEGARTFIRFINIFGISLIVILIGLVRWMIRRRAQKLYEDIYA